MSGYDYPEDGKLHVRYSELVRCTPAGVDAVVFERSHPEVERFENEHMRDGITRHEMWQRESENTGYTPEVFRRELRIHLPVSHVEHQLASEIFPGVVLHSTIDAVSVAAATIIDYKTITGSPDVYRASKQLRLYAYQLALHNLRMTRGLFLIERWATDAAGRRERISGYSLVEQSTTLLDMATAHDWALPRVAMLKAALAVPSA